MKLYGLPGTCSLTVHIALYWIGQPFEFEAVTRESIKQPPYLKLNPVGSVPVFVDGDVVLTQNVSILEYLSEKFPNARLFGEPSTLGRAEARRWLAFCNSDLHRTFHFVFAAQKYLEDPVAQEALRKSTGNRVLELLKVVDQHLHNREWLAHGKSVADAYLYVIALWCRQKGLDISGLANFQAWIARMSKDPGVIAAVKAEGL